MKILCSFCDKPVSTDVPEDTLIDAWVECPECIQKEYEEIPDSKKLIVKKYHESLKND